MGTPQKAIVCVLFSLWNPTPTLLEESLEDQWTMIDGPLHIPTPRRGPSHMTLKA